MIKQLTIKKDSSSSSSGKGGGGQSLGENRLNVQRPSVLRTGENSPTDNQAFKSPIFFRAKKRASDQTADEGK